MDEKLTVKQVGIRYGIYLAIIAIIYTTLLQIMNMAANQSLGYISYIFVIIAIILAHRDYKKSNEFMSYGQGISISMISITISTVVSTIFMYLYIKFIDNSMLELIKQQSEAKMQQRGMSDEQIEQAMAISSKFMTPEMILVFGILGGLLIGFIISLIITAITKKTAPEIPV
jgi:hypothetical protein